MKITGKIEKEGLKAFAKKPLFRLGRPVARIWAVVADKGAAKILMKSGGDLELLGELYPEETMQAELNNKNIGRVASSGGNRHHKFEPHMEQSRQDEFAFAQDIANLLDEAQSVAAFDRLVLVAAPRMLGDLRAAMSGNVQKQVVAEIDKDLTKLDETGLRNALNEILWFQRD